MSVKEEELYSDDEHNDSDYDDEYEYVDEDNKTDGEPNIIHEGSFWVQHTIALLIVLVAAYIYITIIQSKIALNYLALLLWCMWCPFAVQCSFWREFFRPIAALDQTRCQTRREFIQSTSASDQTRCQFW